MAALILDKPPHAPTVVVGEVTLTSPSVAELAHWLRVAGVAGRDARRKALHYHTCRRPGGVGWIAEPPDMVRCHKSYFGGRQHFRISWSRSEDTSPGLARLARRGRAAGKGGAGCPH